MTRIDYEAFNWVSPRTGLQSGRPVISKPGIAEIKPHTRHGIPAGIRQLLTRSSKDPYRGREMWLVTYTAVPRISLTPRSIRVLVYKVDPKGNLGPHWDLGERTLPATMQFPKTDNPAFFGMAVEDLVRQKFRPALLAGGRQVAPGTGGARRGPDVDWQELANFYAELANETGDPFFEALATELTEIAAA
jgi:hypothetical protein